MKLLLLLAPMFLCVSCALEPEYARNSNYQDPAFLQQRYDPYYGGKNSEFYDRINDRWQGTEHYYQQQPR